MPTFIVIQFHANHLFPKVVTPNPLPEIVASEAVKRLNDADEDGYFYYMAEVENVG